MKSCFLFMMKLEVHLISPTQTCFKNVGVVWKKTQRFINIWSVLKLVSVRSQKEKYGMRNDSCNISDL